MLNPAPPCSNVGSFDRTAAQFVRQAAQLRPDGHLPGHLAGHRPSPWSDLPAPARTGPHLRGDKLCQHPAFTGRALDSRGIPCHRLIAVAL
ncbi:hypothetical protein KPATCC21470_8291 [Kitasatospora purpeofusca]